MKLHLKDLIHQHHRIPTIIRHRGKITPPFELADRRENTTLPEDMEAKTRQRKFRRNNAENFPKKRGKRQHPVNFPYLGDLDNPSLLKEMSELFAVHVVGQITHKELRLLRRLRVGLSLGLTFGILSVPVGNPSIYPVHPRKLVLLLRVGGLGDEGDQGSPLPDGQEGQGDGGSAGQLVNPQGPGREGDQERVAGLGVELGSAGCEAAVCHG